MKTKKTLLLLSGAVLATGLASCGKTEENVDFVADDTALTVDQQVSWKDLTNATFDERAKITATLEKAAMQNHLTGIAFTESGGLSQFSPRVKLPTKPIEGTSGEHTEYTYVISYGFGLLGEGKLEGTLADKNILNPTYLQDYLSEDDKTLNMANDKGSTASSLAGYVTSSYIDARLNDTKDGFEYFNSAGSDVNVIEENGVKYPRPLPLDKDGNLLANPNLTDTHTKYRFYVRTGADFKYGTYSTKAEIAKFNGREVAKEDYLTQYKHTWNQQNGLARAAENLEGPASIKGSLEYYNATKDGFNQEAWDKVGIKVGHDDKGDYVDYEFNYPCNPFYAHYFISSPLSAPLPEEFLTTIADTSKSIDGMKAYGSFTDKYTPVDTTLSTGAYCINKWEPDKSIVFKAHPFKDNNYKVLGGKHRYQIPGVEYTILKALKEDPEAAYKEFKLGKFDSAGLSTAELIKKHKDDPYVQFSNDGTTDKLQLNTCTQEEWDRLFGVNGETKPGQSWDVKPIMSNDNFVMGIDWALDRAKYAKDRGLHPSREYFGAAYLANPETGEAYNDTEGHKEAMKSVYGDNWDSDYTQNMSKAVECFRKAATEEVAAGHYKSGDTITIEICLMAESQKSRMGEEFKNYIMKAWDEASKDNGTKGLKLNIELAVGGPVATDVYFERMMKGRFDIAYGGIQGNPFNPLNFMDTLFSGNISGFTLSYGKHTNDIMVKYDGNDYSFEGLYLAADRGGLLNAAGQSASVAKMNLFSNVKDVDGDGSRTIKARVALSNTAGELESSISKVKLVWYPEDPDADPVEEVVDYTYNDGIVTIKVNKDLVARFGGTVEVQVVVNQKVIKAESASTEILSQVIQFPHLSK